MYLTHDKITWNGKGSIPCIKNIQVVEFSVQWTALYTLYFRESVELTHWYLIQMITHWSNKRGRKQIWEEDMMIMMEYWHLYWCNWCNCSRRTMKKMSPYLLRIFLQIANSGYAILSKFIFTDLGINPLVFNFYQFIVAAAFTAPLAFFFERYLSLSLNLLLFTTTDNDWDFSDLKCVGYQ